MSEARAVRSRIELLETVRARALELGATREQIDHVAGFTPGYSAKIMGPRQVRRAVHESFFTLLWSLGLSIVVTEDLAATEVVRPHYSRIRPFGCNQFEAKASSGEQAGLNHLQTRISDDLTPSEHDCE